MDILSTTGMLHNMSQSMAQHVSAQLVRRPPALVKLLWPFVPVPPPHHVATPRLIGIPKHARHAKSSTALYVCTYVRNMGIGI